MPADAPVTGSPAPGPPVMGSLAMGSLAMAMPDSRIDESIGEVYKEIGDRDARGDEQVDESANI